MNNTVAQAETGRPSKSTSRTAPASDRRRASMFGGGDHAREYGRACLADARETVARMSTAVLIDEDDLDVDEFRKMASGLLTNFGGAEDAIDTLAASLDERRATSPTTNAENQRTPAALPSIDDRFENYVESIVDGVEHVRAELHDILTSVVKLQYLAHGSSMREARSLVDAALRAFGHAEEQLIGIEAGLRSETLISFARGEAEPPAALDADEPVLDAAAEE